MIIEPVNNEQIAVEPTSSKINIDCEQEAEAHSDPFVYNTEDFQTEMQHYSNVFQNMIERDTQTLIQDIVQDPVSHFQLPFDTPIQDMFENVEDLIQLVKQKMEYVQQEHVGIEGSEFLWLIEVFKTVIQKRKCLAKNVAAKYWYHHCRQFSVENKIAKQLSTLRGYIETIFRYDRLSHMSLNNPPQSWEVASTRIRQLTSITDEERRIHETQMNNLDLLNELEQLEYFISTSTDFDTDCRVLYEERYVARQLSHIIDRVARESRPTQSNVPPEQLEEEERELSETIRRQKRQRELADRQNRNTRIT